MNITYQRARDSDIDFLRILYIESRAQETAAWGWKEAERTAFLNRQFESQLASYPIGVKSPLHEIILCNSERVGRLVTIEEPESIRLADILLIKEKQGLGIGTRILKDIQEQARSRNKKVILTVLSGNPARVLYERMGFRIVEEEGPYQSMVWMSEDHRNAP